MSTPLTQIGSTTPAAAPARAHLLGMTLLELEAWLIEAGHKKFRAQQLFEWIYRRGVADFQAMTNLSKDFRAWLAEHAAVLTSSVARESVAGDETRKLLLRMPDGALVETVWIPAGSRNTACISSQVGCPVGCRFCASGLDGVERNLTAGEIVEQAYRISLMIREADEAAAGGEAGAPSDRSEPVELAPTIAAGTHRSSTGDRLSNIVMMGMGEPLANYAEMVKALRILNAPWGLGVGARKITVSTVGLPAQIRRLADEGLQINLALSLHATNDQLRHSLIPWGKGVPIADLLDACNYFFEKTGREITIEYVLLADVNDQAEHAEQLARLARRVRANINLLRYNPVAGTPYHRPSAETAFEFQRRLRERGINVHIRTSRGLDADAACGQLRRRTTAESVT